MRYNEVIKGKQISTTYNVSTSLNKRGRDVNQEAINDAIIEKKYNDYIDSLNRKRLKVNLFDFLTS
jgi:hypothetical protein